MQFDDSIIIQCTRVTLRAWHKVKYQRKMFITFTKIMQSPIETFTDFVHSLMTSINTTISKQDVRNVVIEALAFKDSSAECKNNS